MSFDPASENRVVPGDQPYPFWGWADLLLLLGGLIPSFAGAMGVLLLVKLVLGPEASKAVQVLTLQFAVYGFWFLALYLLFRLYHRQPFWQSLAWNYRLPLVLRNLAFGPALAVAILLTAALLRTPKIDMPMEELLQDRFSVALIGLFATTLGPLCEELVFRGFLMPMLCRALGAVAGITLAAVPFALLHGPQYAWSWRHVCLIGLAGVAFGWVRFKSGSTAAATAIHCTYNAAILAGYLISEGDML
ncbi:MAG: CPBP family intramembrane glutamic endopeptidase [Bryobacteraceae bacterium]